MQNLKLIVKAIAAVMASASILSGCRTAGTEDFSTVVKAYSGGVIGSGGTIKVIMAEPVEESIAAGLGQEELDKLFSFSPGIKGNAVFDGKDTFEFIPEEGGIRPGTEYKARFNAGKVRPDLEKKMKTFVFSFRSAVRDASIVADRILIREETPDMAEICGRAIFSEPVDPQAVAEMLSCSMRPGKGYAAIRRRPCHNGHRQPEQYPLCKNHNSPDRTESPCRNQFTITSSVKSQAPSAGCLKARIRT